MAQFLVRPLSPVDKSRVESIIRERWGETRVVTVSGVFQPAELPGLVAEANGEWQGLITYHIADQACEIITLDSFLEGQGIGSALIAAVKEQARAAGCHRLWLITTNDNIHAIRYYQKRGFTFAALHRNVMPVWRLLKPEIPLEGLEGIPLRDALEFEMLV